MVPISNGGLFDSIVQYEVRGQKMESVVRQAVVSAIDILAKRTTGERLEQVEFEKLII